MEYWTIFINVITIHVGGTIVIVLLIEKILYNEKLRERYLDTERLNLTSELSASISHELRNPLTVTSGFLQLLNKSTNINEREKEYIHYSLQELGRAEKIISDFLSLAKPQAENMVLSNLKKEMEYVNNIMGPYANFHKVDIQYEFNNTSKIKFDQNQLQQCLINLYKNGIESMKGKGGTLTVKITGTNDEVEIQVRDTGIGMSKDELSRVGKPYYSTKQEGTGLGLMVVYNTIHKLGGNIKVESEKGIGTTFFISIPSEDNN
ncbi:MAG: HAMP domain-containing histidine kinase [Bacillus sp. (in: Bacteria)]|nr:HAMP domain-containing histidine kinase [Bacillus sp. (in: firmicutes)]